MATPPNRAGSDVATPSVPFSYAQAAKGLAAAPASSKPSSDTTNTPNDGTTVPSILPVASTMSWADDVEGDEPVPEKLSSVHENRSNGAPPVSKQTITIQQPVTASNLSSPDLGASSASTVTKDDDVSSLPNGSSESTWENKSQASTSVDKTVEPAEKTSEKVKGKNLERSTFKPLQEAPLPTVNIWQQRAAEAKNKITQQPAPAKPIASLASPGIPNGVAHGPSGAAAKKNRGATGLDKADSKEKGLVTESKAKGREEEKANQPRKDAKPEADFDRAKKGVKSKPMEKDIKPATTVVPPPPARDQESWPTPETVIDEDRKKSQNKGEKAEKERKDSVPAGTHGKNGWVKVPYTPTVIFNTPLPGAATARRGGRGGGRGGAHTSGRTTGFGAGGAGQPEKDGSAPSALPNGDQPKRGRPDGSAPRDLSPPKGNRAGSAGSPTVKEKSPASNEDRSTNPTVAPETETHSRRASVMTEPTSGSQTPGQANTFTRQFPSSRPNKGRKGEMPFQGERRKEGDAGSPTKENVSSHDRQTSTATQTEIPEDGERRSTFHEGHPSQPKQGPNDRRQYSSFSGRDRPRGGPRGGRGNYQNGNGQQYTNGHVPLQSSSSFPLRSPTTFHPDQQAYFPAAPGRGRGYRDGRDGRSHSVTTENVYGRMPGYPGGPQPPPIQTYMPQMYDYSMMQPMSAVPYPTYGMDPTHLFGMVTTQLEYYFSVENLCKDIYLRKHMDSKGFVFLSFIAEFNRIKQLTTDMELIKLVCWQSRIIDFRVGHDGKERLRRRDGWEQWIMSIAERDATAQNDGPDELYNPPFPQPNGFDKSGAPRFPDMSAISPTGPPLVANEALYPATNSTQNTTMAPDDTIANGSIIEGLNGSAVPNGHPIETSTNIVSGEPDSFSDEQVENLTVVVRRQDQPQTQALPPAASRTFSNGTIDSRSSLLDETEKLAGRQSSLKVNGTGIDSPRRSLSPFAPASATTPVRLFWVKDKDTPIESIPPDSTHESYYHLRSKALQQRQTSLPGTCPYDMDVLYQFWSHFLIRNHNSIMYSEFCHFAFEDASQRMSEVGLNNLIKFYGESLLSPQGIRDRVARDYVELVKSENEFRRPAFKQLRSAWRNGALDFRNRRRLGDLLDLELKASLE